MSETINALRNADRNKLALLASVLPGAGHILKGHLIGGAAILIGGNIMMLFAAAWLAFATLGVSIIAVPVMWFLMVAGSAYFIEDRLHHTPPPISFGARRRDDDDDD